MKFYIASSFANKEKVRYASEQLKDLGHIQTYDWTRNERASSFKELERIGQFEKEAVLEADILIVLLPAGKGSHIEMGMAIGQGKKIYLHSETDRVNDFETTSTFYHLPEVSIVIGTVDKLIKEAANSGAPVIY